MGFVGKAAKKIGKFALGGVLGMVMGKPKMPDMPNQPGPVARDEAAEMAEREDQLRRRRGAAADMLTGTAGAEGGGGAKFVAGN